MNNSIAWKNGNWLPKSEATLELDDLGFLQGAVVVDRLRTVQGVALDVEPHLNRFQTGCRSVGIELPPLSELGMIIEACAEKNGGTSSTRDFALVLLATPGSAHEQHPLPTVIVHPTEIAWQRLANWYAQGQRLVASTHQAIPAACWAPSIKTRSRLQYYLADRETFSITQDRHAAGILRDHDGHLTETSTANILLVEGKRIVSPPRELILQGVSLSRTLRLAESVGYHIDFDEVPCERAKRADAILLCGSTGCLWPASQLDERIFQQSTKHSVYLHLLEQWRTDIGIDFIAQAIELATGQRR